ncbi:MAG: peroxiredoxin [Bdellovibrionaceae bacterium]|nr:peroxiredoxin [Pseudobdellovibrionaceae bacterium]
MRFTLTVFSALLLLTLFFQSAHANDLQIGDSAPIFKTKTHEGLNFDLATRKGSWTVLYFYPKAGTPGCTKQACAFRDNIEKIRAQGADVYGISSDTVEDQAKFHDEHKLTFTLLADPDAKVVGLYGTKMPIMKMSKRWTFVIDPNLKIRQIGKDVDPVIDAEKIADQIASLKNKK